MRNLWISILLVLTLSNEIKAQQSPASENFISIDHIPIVIRDLESLTELLSRELHFKIKTGREHEGIKNVFIKFQDGTYLEFTTPLDSSKATGRFYTDQLKVRQRPTALAISIKSTDLLKNFLTSNSITFTTEKNDIWETISPKGLEVFYINYKNKNWRDTKENTTHPNTAIALKSTYIVSKNINTDIEKYMRFGFTIDNHADTLSFLNLPQKKLTLGKSNLFLIDASEVNPAQSKFSLHQLNGISGFEIMVSSLSTINAMLPKTGNVIFEADRTVCFVEEYGFFLVFKQ